MKTLATYLRHGITYLVGLLVAWFTLHLTVPEDLTTATAAANALIEPLVITAGFVAVILSRQLLTWAGALFRLGAGEKSGDSSGVATLLGLGCTMLGTLAVVTLPACSPGDEYPLTATLSYRDPATGAKAGLTYTPRLKLRGGVTVPVYDAETGEKIGTTSLQVDPSPSK